MSLSAATIDALVAAGVSAEQLAIVLKAEIAEEEARRARQIPWPKLRAMAFARDGHVCQYCGDLDGPFEIDHIIAQANGGEDVLENVCVACRSCNRAKKDRGSEEWSVLNDRRARDRERKKTKREEIRGMSADVRGTSSESNPVLGNDTDPPLPLPLSPQTPQTPTPTPPDITTRAKAVSKRAGPRTQVPDGWLPNEAGRRHAVERGMPAELIEDQAARFVDFHRSKGNLFADVGGAWRTWCGNFSDFSKPRATNERDRKTPGSGAYPDERRANTESRRSAWVEVAAERDGFDFGSTVDDGGDDPAPSDVRGNLRLAHAR